MTHIHHLYNRLRSTLILLRHGLGLTAAWKQAGLIWERSGR